MADDSPSGVSLSTSRRSLLSQITPRGLLAACATICCPIKEPAESEPAADKSKWVSASTSTFRAAAQQVMVERQTHACLLKEIQCQNALLKQMYADDPDGPPPLIAQLESASHESLSKESQMDVRMLLEDNARLNEDLRSLRELVARARETGHVPLSSLPKRSSSSFRDVARLASGLPKSMSRTTLRKQIKRTETDREQLDEFYIDISGTYCDNFGQIFAVDQEGCDIIFLYGGTLRSGILSGKSLKCEGWPPGIVYDTGNVSFTDGGQWTRTTSHPWATISDLETAGHMLLIGKRIRLAQYEVDVQEFVAEGASARVFSVRVAVPEDKEGDKLMLKVQKFKHESPKKKLHDEGQMLQRLDGVPGAVHMLAYGRLRVPGDARSMFFDQKSPYPALLMTVASGNKLAEAKASMTAADEEIAVKQLWEFAGGMYARALTHASLKLDNVFWNAVDKSITVIKFDNAFVWSDNATGQQSLKQQKYGTAISEMENFFHSELLWQFDQSLLELASATLAPKKEASKFPWATGEDLQTAHMRLVEKRVRLREFEFYVEKYLAEGKSARIFLVTVDLPMEHRGDELILKVEKFSYEKPEESVNDEIPLMLMVEGVPHAVQMISHGTIRVPGDVTSMFFDQKSPYPTMLLTKASGETLGNVKDSMTSEDREIAIKQLWEFAADMQSRNMVHADLTWDNVHWDAISKNITILDFGNAFRWCDAPSGKQIVKQRINGNANDEMSRFIQVKLEW